MFRLANQKNTKMSVGRVKKKQATLISIKPQETVNKSQL
jgi:hypothetical protein